MPTRPLKKWTPDVVRQRIRVSKIVRRLIDHSMGLNEMSATQIRAAEILLKKAMPDLSAVEYTNQSNDRPVEEWTDAELVAELGRIRAQIAHLRDGAEPGAGPPAPAEVH
jgi:hypothetical protein